MDGGKGVTVLLVQLVNDLRPVTSGGHPTEPSVGKLGEPRSGNGPYLMCVDCVRHHMDCYDEERGRGKDGRIVIVAKIKRRQRHGERRRQRGFACRYQWWGANL